MKNKKPQTKYDRQVVSDRKAAARERAVEREVAVAAALDTLLDEIQG